MKSVANLCLILLLATTLAAQTSASAKPKKAKAASAAVTAADVQALKDALAAQQAALNSQQKQIQALQDELRRKDQAVQQAQTAATDASGRADAAQAAATQQQQAVGDLKSDVAGLKSTVDGTVLALQDTQKKVSESPLAIHVKGITITPGGFLAAEFVRRSRALAADVNTPLNGLTMPGASQSSLAEFFGSGRQSRVSMLAEGRLASAKISGYIEADFLSAAVTSNNNQSNSYSLRQRQAFGQAAFDNGWSITGGQMWSLVTETRRGVENRQEALPMTIDAQYTVGFSWARQYGLRVAKGFGNKVWFAVAVENPQATVTTHNNAPNFLVGSLGAGGGLYNAFNGNYAFNPSPDIVTKIAFDPGFGHYEVFGVYSRFRDRVFPCGEVAPSVSCGGQTVGVASSVGAFNSSKDGGGFGANARWSFAQKHIDFGLHAFAGDGVGRYGSGGLPDASVHTNGSLDLVRSYQGLSTLEWHGRKLDVYLNAGAEYAARAADYDPINANLYVGYGSPFFNNQGCYSETIPKDGTGFTPGSLKSCTADTRALIEGTSGFWFKVYDGSRDKLNRGRVQWGIQYSYVTRNTWSGDGFEPHGIDNMVFTSFRYYLP